MKQKTYTLIGLIIISLCLISSPASAQNKSSRVDIKGVINDINTAEPILFATVVLVDATDSIQISGTTTNENGEFKFNNIRNGDYFLQFSMIGYHLQNTPVLTISKDGSVQLGSTNIDLGENNTIDLGDMGLKTENLELDAVVIRAKRPLIEMKPGKMVLNIADNDIIRLAENALEMLKKVPGVYIDNDDNISLNGQSGVMVMVDDRPTYLSGKELASYLRTMSSNTILKIEAISSPSSKYDAEGVSGILNIITQKGGNYGFSGTVMASAGVKFTNLEDPGFYDNESLNLSYRGKNVTVYGDFSHYQSKDNQSLYVEAIFPDGNTVEYNGAENEDWRQETSYNSFRGKLGADFYISKKDIISLSYKGAHSNHGSQQPTFVRKSLDGNILTSALQQSEGDYIWQNHHTNLNYEHTFDTVYSRKLYLDFNWIYQSNDAESFNINKNFNGDFVGDPISEDIYNQIVPKHTNILSFNTDYTHPFNTQTKLEVGVKVSASLADNNLKYFDMDSLNTSRSNQFLYNEIIGAAYASVSHTFKTKTSIQAGIRVEGTNTKGNNINLDSINKNFYIRPFPNITISQEIGNDHKLDLSYRYRISRPRYTMLNPFVTKEDANMYSSGNPLLQPTYTNSVGLGYSYKYKLFIRAGYSHSKGTVNRMQYYYVTDLTVLSIPQNMGVANSTYLSISTQLSFFKIWRLTAYLNGSYSQTNVKYNNEWTKENSFNTSLWVSTSIDIIPTLTAEASAWISPPQKSLFNETAAMYQLNLSLKKTFFDKKLSLSLYANDLLGMSYSENRIYPDNSSTYIDSKWNGRSVSLSIAYNFGNTKNMNRSARRVKSTEESSRLGGGDDKGGK